MKNLAAIGLCLATVISALPKQLSTNNLEKRKDLDCEVEWVTVYARNPEAKTPQKGSGSTSEGDDASGTQGGNTGSGSGGSSGATPSATGSAATPSGSASASTGTGSSSNGTSAGTYGGSGTSALNLPNLPNGQPPIPLNDDYIHAPEVTDPVPADALIFTPAKEGVFSPADFQKWQKQFQQNNNFPSKWMKIKPGSYYYDLGVTTHADGADPNTLPDFNVQIYQQNSDWTLDMRGCTFYYDLTPQNKDRRPDTAFYFIQSTGLTVLGGTFWVDQGELWTQARVTDVTGTVDAGDLTATFEVEQGYDLDTWKNAGPRNQYGCVDDSNTDAFTYPACNFWWVNNYNFDKLASDRTFTAHLNDLQTSGIKKGLVVTMIAGPNGEPSVIVNEDNGSLKIRGFTTNGAFMSIGVNAGETPPALDGWYQVNPPPRPGFAPRVRGPGLTFANINFNYFNDPGQPEATFTNSFYQKNPSKAGLVPVTSNGAGLEN